LGASPREKLVGPYFFSAFCLLFRVTDVAAAERLNVLYKFFEGS
jgi:hypothetical protein